MQTEVLMKAMTDSISEVLETMFFLPVDTVSEKRIETFPEINISENILTRLEFSGPVKGYAQLYIPKVMAEEVAVDFLGSIEGNIGDDEIEETVKEMINMIVGNLLSKYDEDAVFDMGIPSLIKTDQPPFPNEKYEEMVSIDVSTLDSQLTFFLFTRDNES